MFLEPIYTIIIIIITSFLIVSKSKVESKCDPKKNVPKTNLKIWWFWWEKIGIL